MADVWLTDRECTTDGRLPPVCVRCGADADRTVRRTFSWYPTWVNILILAGVIPWLIVMLLMTKRMTVYAPVCDRHRNHWLTRGILANGAAVLGFVALIGLMVLGFVLADRNNLNNPDYGLYGLIAGVVVFVVLIVVAVVVSKGTIRADEITDEEIKLAGVAGEFIDAVEDEREARRKARKQRRRRDADEYDEE